MDWLEIFRVWNQLWRVGLEVKEAIGITNCIVSAVVVGWHSVSGWQSVDALDIGCVVCLDVCSCVLVSPQENTHTQIMGPYVRV